VKLAALVAMPPGVVTVIFPVVAPAGTVAVMVVAFTTLKVVAAMPLNCTAEALVRFVPVRVILAPTPALVGVKEVNFGATRTVKLVALVTVPFSVVTLIGPLVEPDCTFAVMVVLFTRMKIDAVPLNFTDDTLTKFVPVMVTTVKSGPLLGVKEVIVGALA